ncbi:MAG: baseplate J/gp47 family protein [Candidatus Saccharibacteria bacterium]|nr:baseplate J/gp47 family protein [Candidatus Saccharibacteria bacterium]
MNKDVIYIEPEDDITDIIAKIEKSKEKIVALVPPKKAGVFRSIVNIKLISKAGASAEKSVVLVTVDPSITKLAAATKIPVAKNLQSAPVIPEVETEEPLNEHTIEDVPDTEEEAEKAASEEANSSKSTSAKHKTSEDGEEPEEEDEEDEEEAESLPKKDKKKSTKPSGNKVLDWIKSHKKLTIVMSVFFVGVIGFLIWAFGFAPAVDITVAIKTDSKNFSEGITFTDKSTDENVKEGKFYLEQKKLEEVQEVEFEATGEKNQGNKATGELIISTVFNASGSVPVNSGTVFTINGLSYVANESKNLIWNGDEDNCENSKRIVEGQIRCLISGTISVTAAEPGSKYNISAAGSGWSTVVPVNVSSDKAMSGGTDDIKTVVQQSDIIKAQEQITSAKEEENKKKLYDSIGDEYYIIDSSFDRNTSSVTSTPAADQEINGGTKPKLTATTTATVYIVNKDKLKEFVVAKADLEDDQKVYDVKNIYIENFSNNGASSTAKLKAQYYIGPKITETEVVEKVKGKGLGDAQREIRDLYGVSNVTIDTSYPWVTSVPSDSNKVTVRFEVKDQDGNEIKANSEENKDENKNNDEKKSEDNKSEDKK